MRGRGDRTGPAIPESGNLLLDALRRDCHALRGLGETVEVPFGAELVAPGHDFEHVYFPVQGVLSEIVLSESGLTAEVFTVGNEGFAGLAVWLGVDTSFARLVQQGTGTLIRIPARDFCHALQGCRRARRLLQGFTAYSLRFAYQTALCNALHSVEQRTSRWLLTMGDRARADTLVMTQELLAAILGVRRQSVGEVAVGLQRDGLIAYRRSDVSLVDRDALERRACECYRVIRDAYRTTVEPLL